jgi:multidrug/hemolysin transport system ATP-binding protein
VNQALLKALDRDKKAYKLVNNRIHISLKNPFEGITLIEDYKAMIDSFEIIKASMDDVFINLTGESIHEEANHDY